MFKVHDWGKSYDHTRLGVGKEVDLQWMELAKGWLLPTWLPRLVSKPGRSQGLLYKHCCSSFTDWVLLFFQWLYGSAAPKRLKMMLPIIKEICWNLEGLKNGLIGSKVTVILLNKWILPIGGDASRRVCACSLRSRLVYILLIIFLILSF